VGVLGQFNRPSEIQSLMIDLALFREGISAFTREQMAKYVTLLGTSHRLQGAERFKFHMDDPIYKVVAAAYTPQTTLLRMLSSISSRDAVLICSVVGGTR